MIDNTIEIALHSDVVTTVAMTGKTTCFHIFANAMSGSCSFVIDEWRRNAPGCWHDIPGYRSRVACDWSEEHPGRLHHVIWSDKKLCGKSGMWSKDALLSKFQHVLQLSNFEMFQQTKCFGWVKRSSTALGGYYTIQLVGSNRKGGRGPKFGTRIHNLQYLPPDLLLHRSDSLSWALQVG